jgi:hypothetical protein
MREYRDDHVPLACLTPVALYLTLEIGRWTLDNEEPGRYHHPSRAARLGTPARFPVLYLFGAGAAVKDSLTGCSSYR